ncbi:MAG: class I SAM-dependent methyltransferase, partial [Chloroflexota bacterium]
MPLDEQRRINRLSWDELAPAHAASPEYAFERFAADPGHISDVVRFDLPRLGDVTGLRGVHLQCHIGTDTVSLARLGARMTGLDFSPASLAEARRLTALAGADVDFVEAELYDAPSVLPAEAFDLVYTGVGALCWLPDIGRWAEVVASLLRPDGRLFLREGHPMMWTLDEQRADGLIAVEYPYFEEAGAVAFDEPGTYVTTDVQFEHTVTWSWNHGLGEIVTALLDAGMRLTMLEEHRSVPWQALDHGMASSEDGE